MTESLLTPDSVFVPYDILYFLMNQTQDGRRASAAIHGVRLTAAAPFAYIAASRAGPPARSLFSG